MQADKVTKGLIVGATILLLSLTCRSALLDGTTCRVKVTPGGTNSNKDTKEFDDTLSFADGKFTSKAFLANGFQSGITHGEDEGKEAEFEIEQTNAVGDVLNWQGEIKGNSVGGKLRWIKKAGGTQAYYFHGTKESASAVIPQTDAPSRPSPHN
jgi:hypothetical protein